MTLEIEERILEFIKAHHVLTLATAKDNQPYCCNCFYVYHPDNNCFVFSSDEDTKHIQDVRQNAQVGASIVLETKTVGKIQGLQITGTLKEAEGDALKVYKKMYLKQFPYAILKSTKLWVLEVDFLKLTDNRLGFGKKIIWRKS